MKTDPNHVAQCRCGAVEIGAWSNPLVVAACYCDDCQAASGRLAASANGAPVASADGGTEFMVFRRDRIACTRGAENLKVMRLRDATKKPADGRRLLRDANVRGLRRQPALGVGVPRRFRP
jgi:hypothetical protein